MPDTTEGINPDLINLFTEQVSLNNDDAKKIADILDDNLRSMGVGSHSESIKDVLRGFNHRGVGTPAPPPNESQGLVFFTRPMLNLSDGNIAMERSLTTLLTSFPKSIPYAIRSILDPVGAKENSRSTPLFDNDQAFIPFLTNLCESVTGWPAIDVHTYTSSEGLLGEQYSYVEGAFGHWGALELSATFNNIEGSPLLLLFFTWCAYMLNVSHGVMRPRSDALKKRYIDYQTRIYKLNLDSTKRYVTSWAATGAGVPGGLDLGAIFNFDKNAPLNEDQRQLSIPFPSVGCSWLDPMTLEEFNACVYNANPAMHPDLLDDPNDTTMIHLDQSELQYFNYSGYPRIMEDRELRWYVKYSDYKEIKDYLDNSTVSKHSITEGWLTAGVRDRVQNK